jgi:hypothetical protein
MDDSRKVEVVSAFSAPPSVVLGLDCLQASPIAQPPIAVEKETDLVQSQKWPVGFGFGQSLELVVRDHGDDFWNEEDVYFPYPLGDFLPVTLLDWTLMGDSGEGLKTLKWFSLRR